MGRSFTQIGEKLKGWGARLLLVGCVSFLGAAQAYEAIQPFQVLGFELKDRLSLERDDHYHIVADFILQDLRTALEFRVLPIRRAMDQAQHNERVCLFPTSAALISASYPGKGFERFVDAVPIDVIAGYVYSAPGQPAVTSFSDIKGVVGHLSGVSIGKVLLSKLGAGANSVELFSLNGEINLVKMLRLGRMDYMVGHHPDVPLANERLGLPPLEYDKDLPLFTQAVTLSCAPFEQHQDVLNVVNQRIVEANLSGLTREALGPHAIVPDLSNSSLKP